MSQGRKKESVVGERSAARISRDFDFPRATVFSMFVDPRKAAKWWGPEESVNLAFELDPRPGGAMRIDDRHPDGTIYRTTGTIEELVVPELLVYRSATTRRDEPAHWEALQTVTFEELGPRRTRVTALVSVLAVGSWPGGADSLKQAFKGGWGESFDRLQRALLYSK
jgi:uncharacterized protein YndB with AHSA1/START domain